MAPSQDGERGERLTNTLFGAKDGGRHRQERASELTSLHRTMRRCALATLNYDNLVRGPKACLNGLIDRQLASETELLDQVPYCRSFFILVLLLRNI